MDSICRQGLHQGQIPWEKEQHVNRNSATYTSSLSTGGCCTTDRVGFKLQSLRSHSHLQWQADRFVSGLWGRVHWSVQGHKSSEPKWPRVALSYSPRKNTAEDWHPHKAGWLPAQRAPPLINDTFWHVTATSYNNSHHSADTWGLRPYVLWRTVTSEAVVHEGHTS